MIIMDILVTNNPLAAEKFKDKFLIDYTETGLLDVLICTRDYIHKGHKLLTHPLSGSVKPNETIYKTVLISSDPGALDLQSIDIIETGILTVQKFPVRQINEKYIYDMQNIDMSLFNSALES